MAVLQRTATAGLIILGAGGLGFLLYRLSVNDHATSFEDRINAGASVAASTAPDSSPPGSDSAALAEHSAREVLAGSDADTAGREPDRPAAPAAPTHIPSISLPDLSGKSRSMSEWRGRPLMVNFWATWCEPCRQEIPLLLRLRAEHAKERLEVVGIAIDFHDAVAAYAKQAGMIYPVLIAEQDATAPRAFGVGMGLPTTVFADAQGRIVATHVGELRPEQAEAFVALALRRP